MNRLAPYLQAAPLALVFLLFFALPMVLVVMVSFFDYQSYQILIPAFTLQNYDDVFSLSTTYRTYLQTIRVINPNTTASMTEKIGAAARAVAAPGTEIVAVTPDHGPVSIEGHYDEALSVFGMLEAVRASEAEGCDGYVIACFGDPGLLAAREIAHGPVLGIAEAAMHAASLIATGFSVVTTLARTRIIAEHLVELYGMRRHCRRVRATDLAVLDLEAEGSAARVSSPRNAAGRCTRTAQGRLSSAAPAWPTSLRKSRRRSAPR